MAIELTDDGTLDTVLRCSKCGEEMRYNYDSGPDTDEQATKLRHKYRRQYPAHSKSRIEDRVNETLYCAFVDWAIEDATADHECALDPDAPPTEPDEDDITTTDHEKYYQNGKLVLLHAANGSWYRLDMKAFPAGVLIGEFGDDHKSAIRAFMGARTTTRIAGLSLTTVTLI